MPMPTARRAAVIAAGLLALAAAAASAASPAAAQRVNVQPTEADASAAQSAKLQYRKLWTGAKPGARPEDRAAHRSGAGGAAKGGPHEQIRFPGDLQFHGGPVITNMIAHAIFMLPSDGTCPSSTACWGDPERFLTDLGRSEFIHVTDQYVGTDAPNRYTVGADAQVPYTRPTDAAGHPIPFTDAQMQAVIHAVVTQTGGATGYGNIYHVFLPPGQDECFTASFKTCASNIFCAYHGSTDFPDIGHVVYSIEPYANVFGCQAAPNGPNGQLADSTDSVLSHETIEAITDPDGTAWWNSADNGLFGEEIGDECSFLTFDANGNFLNFNDEFVSLNGHPYLIQPEYNNNQHACTAGPGPGRD